VNESESADRAEQLRAAVSVGILSSDAVHRDLLQSIVDAARAIFGSRAASIQLFDEETDELVFEAVAGEGSETLIGQRYPSGHGIAGWVLASRQSLVIEDVAKDPRFSKDFAESTGFVPKGLMAVPLLHEERALGVLEVLDRPQRSRFSLEEMDLLSLFANQAAIALEVVGRARRASALARDSGADMAAVTRLASALDALEGERREAGIRLLQALEDVLTRR
jgi:GAF domain-containing protein